MAQVQGHNVAGLGERQDESIPPHWNCYVTVEDADASAARAAELGATLVAPPFDVFDAGRMAAFADPQGAVLSVWQPKENIGAGLVNAVGALTWNDLVTPDVEASAAFYSALFGWQIAEVEGSDGQYWSITNGGRINGGLLPIIEGGHPAWNLYFACEDVDADGGEGQRARRGDLHGPDGRAQRVALRDPARPRRRVLQRLGRADGRLGARSSQSSQSTPVSPRYAATATPRVGKKRSAPIASSMP